MTKTILFAVVYCLLFCTTRAQTFVPDKTGYIGDPKFRQLIKAREYFLVGSFDTIQEKPLILAARFMKKGVWGLIDNHGKVLNDPRFSAFVNPGDSIKKHPEDLRPNKDYYICSEGTKQGICDNSGRTCVPIIYDQVDLTKDNIVIVKKGGLSGAFTANGKVLLPIEYQNIWRPSPNYFVVKKSGYYGVVSLNNKILIPIKYEYVAWSYSSPNIFVIPQGGKEAIFNLQNKQITPFKYDHISGFEKCGVSVFQTKGPKGTKNGLIDTLGNERIAAQYDDIYTTSSLRLITANKKNPNRAWLMDLNGHIISQHDYVFIGFFHGGYATVQEGNPNNGKFGIIDSTGKEVIETKYTILNNVLYNCGITKVELNGKDGLVDKRGAVVLPIIYDGINSDSNGKKGYIVIKSGKYGIASPEGKLLINPDLDGVLETGQFGFIVQVNKKFGFVNDDGKILIPFKFDQFKFFGEKRIFHGIMRAKYEGRVCLVDMYGGEYFGTK